MLSDVAAARPRGIPVHATAVAIGKSGLLILGPSGSGKSRLAGALIAASTRREPVRLVGDDRILLADDGDGCWARPHPRIAGFIERRGFGIVATPHVERVRLAALAILAPTGDALPAALDALPRWKPSSDDAASVSATEILVWWRDVTTTPGAKPRSFHRLGAKD